MRVLNLVANENAPFFEQQMAVLEERGIEHETLSVPGTHDADNTRSVLDYVRFHAPVLKRSLDSFDVVHANYGLTAPAALLQPNRPVVLSLWGSDLMGTVAPVSKWCARHCDAVIVMSDEMAEEVNGECEVIPHGVDTELFEPMPQATAQREIGWSSDRRHVLFPYAPDREVKNYPRAERVVSRTDDALESPVELHAVSGIPHDQVPVYMNAADALLLTSNREGSPNSVKEALACNLPVVATDVGDVRSLLDGVAPSFVCRNDDELVRALVETLERNERSNGRHVANQLSLEEMGRRIESVYRTVRD